MENNEMHISRTIDFLRFPLAVMVVYIHSFALFNLPYAIEWSNLDGMAVYNCVRIYISLVLTHVAVPAFYLISGFLFFKGLENWNVNVYLRKIRSRFGTLVIPYISWITLAILIGCILQCVSLLHHNESLLEIKTWAADNIKLSSYWNINEWNATRQNWIGGLVPTSAPYLVPLWFIRDLIVMVAISPLLYFCLKKGKIITLSVLFLCYISQVWPYFPGFNIESIFYFSIGGWLSINKMYIKKDAPPQI